MVDERAAQELYLKAYEGPLTDGGASSVMCSYAKYRVAGVQQTPAYACENPFGMQDVLRHQFGFTGWIGSDYGASHATSDILVGLDQEFLSTNLAPAALKPLVDPSSPTFDPAYARALDEPSPCILYQYQRFGRLDDSSYPPSAKTHVRPAPAPGAFDEQAGIELARRLAVESAVLLKNDNGVLPLARWCRVRRRHRPDRRRAARGTRVRALPRRRSAHHHQPAGRPQAAARQRAASATRPGSTGSAPPSPQSALSTTPGGPAGLTRTTTAPDGTVIATQVDARLAGNQTDLAKGNTYTWTGYVNVPAADTWTLWLQRPAGTVVGSPSGPNGGVNPGYQAGPFTGVFDSASLSVDGTAAPLTSVSTLHPNDYKGGPTLNGQYLGLTTVGAAVTLTPGEHQISLTYATSSKAATAPTMRLSWAPQRHDVDAAVAAAARARTAVVFVDDADTTTRPGDVSTLGPGQDALIEKVAAANPNTVVVLNTGAGVLMPWLSQVKGVLEMWFPGQEGGTATATLLLGKDNPSGKLPITFPASNSATPFAGHPERTTGVNGQIIWSEGLQMGYRWYLANHIKPLFPFGFGLSYSSFSYRDIHVKGPHGHSGDIQVSFRIRNTGRVTRLGDSAAVPDPARDRSRAVTATGRLRPRYPQARPIPNDSPQPQPGQHPAATVVLGHRKTCLADSEGPLRRRRRSLRHRHPTDGQLHMAMSFGDDVDRR